MTKSTTVHRKVESTHGDPDDQRQVLGTHNTPAEQLYPRDHQLNSHDN